MPSSQTLAPNSTLSEQEPELLGEMVDSETRARVYKMSPEPLIVPESKEILLKNKIHNDGLCQRIREPTERAPND